MAFTETCSECGHATEAHGATGSELGCALCDCAEERDVEGATPGADAVHSVVEAPAADAQGAPTE